MSGGVWLHRLAIIHLQEPLHHFSKVEFREVMHHERVNQQRETTDLCLRKMFVIEERKIIWKEKLKKGTLKE